KYDKKLYSEITGGETPVLVQCPDETSQSVFIVDEILNLNRRGTPFSDIAVLFRAGYHAFGLEVELARAGISYVKYGGYKFMESAHVKDLLAHLRVAAYPGDRISWSRILLLLDHVGPRTADQITEKIVGGGLSAVKPKPAWAESWARLAALVRSLNPDRDSVSEMAGKVMEYYEPVLKERHDNWPKRMKDLEQLLEMAERYDHLSAFLSDMALEPPTDSVDGGLSANREHEDKLVLSTVHSAKGLEWGTVFVLYALDGRFPAMQAVMRQGDNLEEELRLMYVAATRAKEKLFFTYPTDVYDHASGAFLYRPSRFIANISEEFLSRMRC
ncbi:MAG: ATP-dependent helicase, partial [Thermodesulfobacteriota bacterium]